MTDEPGGLGSIGRAEVEPADGTDEVALARLEGEIDIANSRTVAKDLLEQVSPDDVGMVVDLSDVRYIDSAGIRMLFEVARTLTAGRRSLAFSVPEASPLRRLFAVTQMDVAAPVRRSVQDAVEEVRRRAVDAGG